MGQPRPNKASLFRDEKQKRLRQAEVCLNSDALYARLRSGHFIIAGPCVLENFDLARVVAHELAECAAKHGLFAVFNSSYDKANRTSLSGFRGPGMRQGLDWLSRIREETGLPVITDIHEAEDAAVAAQHVDILQIPAFLCRQTSLLLAAGKTGRVINIKKGQFLAPWDMRPVAEKAASTGNSRILLTERGTTFGYNNLVVDMRALPIMAETGYPVVFDATHSVQLPGGQGNCSGGERKHVPALARAAAAAGVQGIFLECHPDPDKALCDGPNSWPLHRLSALLRELSLLWSIPNEA